MRLTEKILFGIALIGLLFKMQHWPFAGVMVVLSLSSLALLYFPLAAIWFGRPAMRDQVIGFSIAGGFALSTMLIGFLFKLQHWPMANAYVTLGTFCCALIAVLCLVLRRGKPVLSSYFRSLLLRASILGGLGALSIFGRSLKQTPALVEGEQLEVLAPSTPTLRDDWAQQIADSAATGVFVLFEPDSNRIQVSDSARAFKGFLPASTFKIFNALVALQEGAVKDEHTIIPWDGAQRQPHGWNEDQDMVQAMERSTVWWYQEVARRAGPERMQHWLDTVGYGNRTMGDSIHLFWLQGGLRITAMEQLDFVQRLHEERLPFDVVHQRTVRNILPCDSTATWKLQGKTGWAIRVDEEYGWFVGWVQRGGRIAYFALNIDIHDMNDVRKRKTLSRALLQREGWID